MEANKELLSKPSNFLNLMQQNIEKDRKLYDPASIDPFRCIEVFPDLLVRTKKFVVTYLVFGS